MKRTPSTVLLCSLLPFVASPAVAQERAIDRSLATLCTVLAASGSLTEGAEVGCPVVLPVLPASDRPCRTRFVLGTMPRWEARLQYDAAGRLQAVDGHERGHLAFTWDLEGRMTASTQTFATRPPVTTTFTWTADTVRGHVSGTLRSIWHLEGGRAAWWETLPDATGSRRTVTRTWVSQGVVSGVSVAPCRATPDGGERCESEWGDRQLGITRDRAGRIVARGHMNVSDRYRYTWDGRGRITRIRHTEVMFSEETLRFDTLVDYVCPAR